MDVTSFLSNIISIAAGGIALYLFFFKKEKIKTMYFSLVNILDQISSHEIKAKLEKLNDFNCNDLDQKIEVVNIMHEIIGQIQGNEKLSYKCGAILKKWKAALKNESKFNEPTKRSLISEMRESLKRVDMSNIDQLIGDAQ
jgi:hypothetical protein